MYWLRSLLPTAVSYTHLDIIKIAMVRVFKRLAKECPEAKLLLQVHDELIVEAPESTLETAQMILKEEMEHEMCIRDRPHIAYRKSRSGTLLQYIEATLQLLRKG